MITKSLLEVRKAEFPNGGKIEKGKNKEKKSRKIIEQLGGGGTQVLGLGDLCQKRKEKKGKEKREKQKRKNSLKWESNNWPSAWRTVP